MCVFSVHKTLKIPFILLLIQHFCEVKVQSCSVPCVSVCVSVCFMCFNGGNEDVALMLNI